MRFALAIASLGLLASGCVSASYSIERPRSLASIAVAKVDVSGSADINVATERRAALINTLRAQGYDVVAERPGVPVVRINMWGKTVNDAQMHGPDDRRHGIENDLHYDFVAYHVDVEIADGNHVLAMAYARSDHDPAPALDVISQKLFSALPPSTGATPDSSTTEVAAR